MKKIELLHDNENISFYFLNPAPSLPLNNKGRVEYINIHQVTPLPFALREGVGGMG